MALSPHPRWQFLSLPNAPLSEAQVVVVPVPLEETVSYQGGTARAPEAILEASDQLEFYDEDSGFSPLQHLTISVTEPVAPAPDEAEGAFHERLAETVAALPGDGLLIALGGEHSITPSLVAGRMPEPGTVVHLDAHADLRPCYLGSPYSHACPVHRLLEQGHRVISVGIRSIFEKEAERIATEPRLELYRDRLLQRPEVWQELTQKLGSLEGPVFLSIDMDAFDPGQVPGVGTPQPGGLSWFQVLDILETLLGNAAIDLRGMDIVELVPDGTRVSEMTAAKLMLKAMAFWGKAKGYDRQSKTGSQMKVDYE